MMNLSGTRAVFDGVPWVLVLDTSAAFMDLSVLSRVEMAIASGNKYVLFLLSAP